MYVCRPMLVVVTCIVALMSSSVGSAPASAHSRYPPLSSNSLYWLNSGSGFTLHAPTARARISESLALHTAVTAASVSGAGARVLEIELKGLISTYHNWPNLNGRTFWVVSLMPKTVRMHFRWFFVLVDARTGRVGDVFNLGWIVEPLRVHAPGETPLVSLPGVSLTALANSGYLLDPPHVPAVVTRARALQVAQLLPPRLPYPTSRTGLSIVLATVWGAGRKWEQPAWIIGRPGYRYKTEKAYPLPSYELIFVSARTGRPSLVFCCVSASRHF